MTTAHIHPAKDATRHRVRFGAVAAAEPTVAAACGFVVLMILFALLGPIVATHEPNAQALTDRLHGPSGNHWLGTDQYGRDVFSRLAVATRVSLVAVAQSVGVATLLGVGWGLVVGYRGRWIDAVVSRAADAIMSLPPLMLLFAVVGVVGQGLTVAMLTLGVVMAPRVYRVTRASTRTIAGETYIEAANSIGCSSRRILLLHVLPNALPVVLVQISFCAGLAVSAESTLSFLGLGVAPPTASWGSMLQDAYQQVYDHPDLLIWPSLLITSTVLALFTVSDGVQRLLFGTDSHVS